MPRIPNTRPTSIYWLYDMRPETIAMGWKNGFPFYCGKTVQKVTNRLLMHRKDAVRFPDRLSSKWINACGSHIRVETKEIVPADGDWIERERFGILTLRALYPGGANTSAGGEGVPGAVCSPEKRAKLRAANLGKKLSAEHRAKLIASVKGKKRSVEFCAKLSNRVISDETRAKISAAKLGKKRSPETCAKISAGKKGKKQSPEAIANRSVALRGRITTLETRAKMRVVNLGKTLSVETREKIRAYMLGRKRGPYRKRSVAA